MSARIYFMKRLIDWKDVLLPQVYSVCILQFSCFTSACSQNINKQIVNIADAKLLKNAFSVGITILNQRIILKDDVEFVTEFPCLLVHSI